MLNNTFSQNTSSQHASSQNTFSQHTLSHHILSKNNNLALSSTARPSKMWLLGLAALGLVGCFDNSEPVADKSQSDAQASTQVSTQASTQASANAEMAGNTQLKANTNIQAITESQAPPSLCHQTWYQDVENELNTQDGQGHGPDLGSTEWRSVVEFKLNIRDDNELPSVESDDWCQYIDEHYLQVQD